MVKHTQTIRWQKPANCLSVFDLFVGLELKGLKNDAVIRKTYKGGAAAIENEKTENKLLINPILELQKQHTKIINNAIYISVTL